MPKPNAAHAPDPMVPSSSHDPRFSPDAGESAWSDIPMAPDTLAAMKKADPVCSVGSGNDHAGVVDNAVREGAEGY
jgi:hypothetical protein